MKILFFVLVATVALSSCATTKQTENAGEIIIYEAPSLSAMQIERLKEGESAEILETGGHVLVEGIESKFV
jgi:outer membrane protein assembly factor BamE (lipoprotein component of BamABCDE complex)